MLLNINIFVFFIVIWVLILAVIVTTKRTDQCPRLCVPYFYGLVARARHNYVVVKVDTVDTIGVSFQSLWLNISISPAFFEFGPGPVNIFPCQGRDFLGFMDMFFGLLW